MRAFLEREGLKRRGGGHEEGTERCVGGGGWHARAFGGLGKIMQVLNSV